MNIYIFLRRKSSAPFVSDRLPRALRADGGEGILGRSPWRPACRRQSEAHAYSPPLCSRTLKGNRPQTARYANPRHDRRVAHHCHSTLCPGESAGCMCLHLDFDPALEETWPRRPAHVPPRLWPVTYRRPATAGLGHVP